MTWVIRLWQMQSYLTFCCINGRRSADLPPKQDHPVCAGHAEVGAVWRIGKTHIRRLLSRGNTSPSTTLDNFFRLRSAWHTPPFDWSPQTHPCFPLYGVSRVSAA